MKILKLEILNLASLDKRGGEVINFEEGALGESTIFSIVGPTGSGKSTILDAICLALYNRAPRYPRQSGGRDRIEVYGTKDREEANRLSPTDGRNILSRGKKDCYSKLTFLANNGSVYRAEWSVHLKTKKYEDAMTSLYRIVRKGDKTEEEVGDWNDLPQIIGLDYDQFLRTVLIAQGSFANFLTAKVDERYALLEKLIGCEDMYTRIAEEIKVRKDTSCANYNEIKASFEAYEKDDLTPEQLDALNKRITELQEAENIVKKELEVIGKALSWYADEEKLKAGLVGYKEALDKAQSVLEAMKESVGRLALHDATLPAVDLYKEKKLKTDLCHRIADELKALSVEVENRKNKIADEEKLLQHLEDAANKAIVRLTEEKPHINAARTIKAQLEAEKRNAEEKEKSRTKAEREWKQAQNALEANAKAIIKNEEVLANVKVAYDTKKESVDKKREELQKQVEEAAGKYGKEKKKLEEKNLEELQKFKDGAVANLQDLKDAIRVLHEWKEKEQQKSKDEREVGVLTQRNLVVEEELGKLTIDSLKKELEIHRETYTLLISENWNLHRQSLVDGEACPLCGAKHHPYQNDEVFKPVVTELKTLIDEKQECLKNQEKCRLDLANEQSLNKGKVESYKKSLVRLEAEIGNLKKKWDEIARKHADWKADEEALEGMQSSMEATVRTSVDALDEYNRIQREVNLLQAKKEAKEVEQKKFTESAELELKQQETKKTEAFTALETEKAKTETLSGQKESKKEELASAIKALELVREVVGQKVADLKAEIGEKDPDAFEKELTDAQSKATVAVGDKKELISRLKQRLGEVNGSIRTKETQLQEYKAEASEKEQQLLDWLHDYNMVDIHEQKLMLEDIVALYEATDDWEYIRKERERSIQAHTSAWTTYQNGLDAQTEHQLSKPEDEREVLEARKKELEGKDSSELVNAKAQLQRYQKAKEAMGEMYAEKQMAEQVLKDWTAISDAIGGADGKTLRKIAQCYTLRFLIEHANAEIRKFNSRYELVQVKNSLGIRVIDHDRADDIRDTSSLSGGETFIVSLGLALGLSALSSRNISFENLFIDEGFGTLDPDALATVIDSLAMLQNSQGKKVGVISHTDTMSERITTQIRIVKNGSSGSSHIEIYPE